MATFEDLKGLLGEPGFLWSDPSPWERLESELGVQLPEDFRTFSDAYGPVLINNQLDIGHPAVEYGNLRETIRRSIDVWRDAPEGMIPYPIGAEPGNLLPWAGSSSGEAIFFRVPDEESKEWGVVVYEHDDGECHEYAMTFNEWMLAYLRGDDVTVCSGNFAPSGPFFEPLSQE